MLRKLPEVSLNPSWPWLLAALVFKAVVCLWLLSELDKPGDRLLGLEGHDAYTYFDPIDQWLEHGTYMPDYRLPGFLPVYLPLRFFMERTDAWNVLIVLQLLASVIATWLLARTAFLITGSKLVFLVTFFAYALNTYVSVFDIIILSESFATSLLIFAFYFLTLYWHSARKHHLFISGILLTWTVFLKPAFVLVFLLAMAVVVLKAVGQPSRFKQMGLGLFVLLVPFLVLDGAWVIRNYKKYEGLYPFSRTLYYPAYYTTVSYPVSEFVTAIGGSFAWWEPTAEIRWFGKGTREIFTGQTPQDLPDYIYTKDFNRDSLALIREKFTALYYNESPPGEREKDSLYLFSKLPLYQRSFKEHKPFYYHIVAPLRLCKRFLVHSGTYNLFPVPFSELNWLRKLLKLFYSGLYLVTLLLGLAGIVMALAQPTRYHLFILTCAGLVGYSIALFPIVLRLDEFRYFVPSFPFLIICAAFAIHRATHIFKLNSHKRPNATLGSDPGIQ